MTNFERAPVERRLKSVPKTDESLYDDNNNDQTQLVNSNLLRKQRELKPIDNKNESNAYESDEWHLLEVDDPLSSCGNDKYDNNMSCVKKDSLTSSEKKYIEIDQVEPENGHSQALIYLCTAVYSLMPIASVLVTFTLVALLFTKLWYLTLLYVAYVFLDKKTCNRGGRRIAWVYQNKFWTYLAAYFPIKLRHSNEFKLDPNENYILNYHPHGISAFGAVTVFATNGFGFCKLFPGITSRFMVHETSFATPVLKETFSLRGDCSVNSSSIDYMLSSKARTGKAGNLLTIVGGGLAEADLSDAETLKIVVRERKGFVKKAMIHGAHLVPCIAFGENSVFNNVHLAPTSFIYKLQSKWYQLFKFKHPVYYGRSILSERSRGVMPYRRPITVVMGDPIRVARIEKPSQMDIDQLHAKYLKHLEDVYKSNADLCVKFDTRMELI